LRKTTKGDGYLFNHKALAKVFRAKFLAAVDELGLQLPPSVPQEWVVDCKCVGNGQKALVYLGRYLYRGGDSRERYCALRARPSDLPLA
jgi:Putative transposase